jgi:hypothetical protein
LPDGAVIAPPQRFLRTAPGNVWRQDLSDELVDDVRKFTFLMDEAIHKQPRRLMSQPACSARIKPDLCENGALIFEADSPNRCNSSPSICVYDYEAEVRKKTGLTARGKMNEFNETTILQEGLVRITNRRTLIGTQTYPMSKIKSVTVTRRGKDTRPIWLILAGSLFLLWSIIDQTGYYSEFFNWGIVLGVIGLVLTVGKTSYVIQIRRLQGSRYSGSTDLS